MAVRIQGGLFDFVNTRSLLGTNVGKAKGSNYHFVVSIIRINDRRNVDPQKDHICTGTLITPHDVVTASHCLENEFKIGIRIIIGSTDLRKGEKYSLFWYLTYDQWANRSQVPIEFDSNDVANIRLLKSIPRKITPVEIADFPNPSLYGIEVFAAGWGKQINDTELSPILSTAKLLVLTNNECQNKVAEILHKPVFLDERQALCTFVNPYALLMNGDSGGPLLFNKQLIGIHKGTCPYDTPDVYPALVNVHSSLHYYKEFINSMKKI